MCALASVALGLCGCEALTSSRQTTDVTIAASTFPASAPVYVAEQQGFFEDYGLDVKVRVYNSGSAALDASIAGEADYATVADTPIVQAVVQGRPFSVLATMAQVDEANVIVTSRDRGIRSAEDLKGKRIGLTRGTTGDFFLHIYLAIARVKPEDVQIVDLPTAELVGALLSGDVDAISTWSPFTTRAVERLGSDAVVLDQPGLYLMSWNLTRAAESELGSDVDERVLRALKDAEAFIREHPERARQVTSRKCGVPLEDLRKQWPNFRWALQLDQSLMISFEDEANWMLAQRGEAGRQLDFLEHVDTGPLEAVDPDMVTLVGSGD